MRELGEGNIEIIVNEGVTLFIHPWTLKCSYTVKTIICNLSTNIPQRYFLIQTNIYTLERIKSKYTLYSY